MLFATQARVNLLDRLRTRTLLEQLGSLDRLSHLLAVSREVKVLFQLLLDPESLCHHFGLHLYRLATLSMQKVVECQLEVRVLSGLILAEHLVLCLLHQTQVGFRREVIIGLNQAKETVTLVSVIVANRVESLLLKGFLLKLHNNDLTFFQLTETP